MKWIRVDQAGRWIVIRPLLIRHEGQSLTTDMGAEDPHSPRLVPNDELLQALADIGVENPKRNQLARLDLDPLWVRAWDLWARHPHRHSLTSPMGNIILKLESREQPPDKFLREAKEQRRLRDWIEEDEQGFGDKSEQDDDRLESLAECSAVPIEMQMLWVQALGELELQMTPATFDTWLRGSRVVAANEAKWTVAVRHAWGDEKRGFSSDS
jgi:hypothetical protein